MQKVPTDVLYMSIKLMDFIWLCFADPRLASVPVRKALPNSVEIRNSRRDNEKTTCINAVDGDPPQRIRADRCRPVPAQDQRANECGTLRLKRNPATEGGGCRAERRDCRAAAADPTAAAADSVPRPGHPDLGAAG